MYKLYGIEMKNSFSSNKEKIERIKKSNTKLKMMLLGKVSPNTVDKMLVRNTASIIIKARQAKASRNNASLNRFNFTTFIISKSRFRITLNRRNLPNFPCRIKCNVIAGLQAFTIAYFMLRKYKKSCLSTQKAQLMVA